MDNDSAFLMLAAIVINLSITICVVHIRYSSLLNHAPDPDAFLVATDRISDRKVRDIAYLCDVNNNLHDTPLAHLAYKVIFVMKHLLCL